MPLECNRGVMFGSRTATFRALSGHRLPWREALVALLLSLVLLTLPAQPALAWPFPSLGNRSTPQVSNRGPLAPKAPTGRLQEVPPPAAVQQLQQALAAHQPAIEIAAPLDGAMLDDGPWDLKIRVHDWPLANAGSLGLGAHVVVQIDDLPPQRLVAAAGGHNETELVVRSAPLQPGSHRITAYAARPWGEAVKSPGAVQQIRVHRVAANPQALPAPGSVQLLPVSPAELSQGEPVLLDWILLDAPLQNLRPGDGSWRLRVTINGDSFLVDQNVPLWLRGWRSGSNSLLLELVDGLGEPLNPPFNSHVQEVKLDKTATALAPSVPWLQGALSDHELAQLLGQAPPSEVGAITTILEPDPEPAPPPMPSAVKPTAVNPATEDPAVDTLPERATPPPPDPLEPAPTASAEPTDIEPETDAELATATEPDDTDTVTTSAATPVQPVAPASAPERISSSTALEGSARELVNPDGSLIQPQTSGLLGGLRQRLNR